MSEPKCKCGHVESQHTAERNRAINNRICHNCQCNEFDAVSEPKEVITEETVKLRVEYYRGFSDLAPEGWAVMEGPVRRAFFYDTKVQAEIVMRDIQLNDLKIKSEANAKKAEIAVKALELIDNRYDELSYIEMGELQIIAQTALKELSELMKEKP